MEQVAYQLIHRLNTNAICTPNHVEIKLVVIVRAFLVQFLLFTFFIVDENLNHFFLGCHVSPSFALQNPQRSA